MLGTADVEPGRWQKQNDGDDDGDNNDGNSSNSKQDWNRKNVQSRESRVRQGESKENWRSLYR